MLFQYFIWHKDTNIFCISKFTTSIIMQIIFALLIFRLTCSIL
ncbi:hypothetical protein PI172_2179 [Prevotella intermedia]|uniref:Uncharacterized protein n=1 Tax=Prevotella intermedia TaxID=28131 RepID=A0AAD1F8C3_PREIN|nr:hypothetical protein PI172_2179 [Prevotella intermedia]